MTTRQFLVSAFSAAVLCFAGGLAVAKFSKPTEASGSGMNSATAPGAEFSRSSSLTALDSKSGGRKSAAHQFSALCASTHHGLYHRACGVFRLIAEADPDEMPALIAMILREMPEDFGGDIMIVAAAERWAALDPKGAFSAALDGKGLVPGEAFDAILLAVAKHDPRGAWQQILEADTQGGKLANQSAHDRVVASFLTTVGEQDMYLAIELYNSSEPTAAYRAGLDIALKNLARLKPIEFLDHYEKMPFRLASDRNVAIEQAFKSIGTQDEDFAQALDRLDRLNGTTRSSAETGLAQAWAETDPSAALEWADGLGLDSQLHAKATILSKLAAEDPVAAAAAVLAQSNPRVRSRSAAEVARAWVRQDRDAALVWVRDELEGKGRQSSYTTLLNESIRHADFENDFEILKEMADGDPHSVGVHSKFASTWASNDPQAAALWAVARSIGVFEAVAERWADSDPDALQRFAATLEDDEMAKVAADQIKNENEKHRVDQSSVEKESR